MLVNHVNRESLLVGAKIDSPRCKICEWLTLLVLLIPSVIWLFIGGYHQDIVMINGNLKNPEINHPLKADTVSTLALTLPPLVSFFLLLCCRALNTEKRWFGVGVMAREMAWSLILALLITGFAKLYVGRPRPNFFELCEWDGTKCTTEEINAYQSFPSGHASLSMSTFGLICIHFVENVLWQLRGYKVPWYRLDASPNGWAWNLFSPITTSIGPPAILIALLPGFWAFFISCSRIHDYRHFVSDVLAGAVIGLCCALLSCSLFRKKESLPYHEKANDENLTIVSQ